MKAMLLATSCVSVLLSLSGHVSAADRSPAKISPDVAARALAEHMRGAVDPTLMMLKEAQGSAPAARRSTPQAAPGGIAGLTMHGPRVGAAAVRIEALSRGDDAALMAQLSAAGATNVRVSGNLVLADMPLASVEKLASVTQAKFVRPSARYVTNIGAVTSQGDPGQKSDIARAKFGVNGKGATVGILSDSWNALGGAPAGIASGDLPGPGNPNGFVTPVNILQDAPPGEGTDEGRGMGEIVHDVAPGAALAFYGPQSVLDHADGVRALAKAGATVVVDDISWFSDPWYQPSPIGLAARDVGLKNNTVVFSSAGNRDRDSVEGMFKALPAKDLLVDGVSQGKWQLHDWGNGAATFPITVPAGADITFVMQWDEPFASASINKRGAQSDLDLFVFLESQGVNVLFASAFNDIDADAVEAIGFSFNPPDPNAVVTLHVGVGRASASAGGVPGGFKIVAFDSGNPVEFDRVNLFNKPTILGHSNSEWIISSCAVRYDRINDATGPRPQLFSSVGGFKRTRDQNGNRLFVPLDTRKPDVCSPNGGNTTFFGFDFEPDGLPNFFGTSASAPHAAGVAALMQEASRMRIPAFAIGPLMRIIATDMDDPFATPTVFDKGYDAKTGSGFLDAEKAVFPATFFRFFK
ncbi:MAG: S8 family peptidase [Burkholderiaceae bacterium]